MHPCSHMLEQLEFSTGSLGHGLGVATGICYALKLKKNIAKNQNGLILKLICVINPLA